MPGRNRVKIYAPESYYHVYNRGVNKQPVFADDYDFSVFLNLLKRYLSKEPVKDNSGREYKNFYGQLELLAFCLMPNHFHLLVYQNDKDAMTALMQSLATSYTMHFNKSHKRTGPLFEDRFKASMITSDEYLQHISRYIHLNPEQYKTWEFSSLSYYTGKKNAEWVRPRRILELFDNDYLSFLEDYKDYKKSLDAIKYELANNPDE